MSSTRSSASTAPVSGPAEATVFDRFAATGIVRRRGDYRVVRAWDPAERRPVVVVAGDERASRTARRRLCALGDAHRAPPHPGIARAIAVDVEASTPYVAFATDASIDLETVVEAWTTRSERIPYRWGTALADVSGEMWASLMESPAQPMLGAICLSNFIITPTGEVHVIGLGENVLALRDDGRPSSASSTWMSMSVALGEPAQGFDDALAFQRMLRSLASLAVLPAPLARVLSNRSGPLDAPLASAEEWIARRLFESGSRDTSARHALVTLRRFWAMIDASPDHAGLKLELAAHAAHAAHAAAMPARAQSDALAIDRAGRAILVSPDGPFAFGRKPVLWRLLAAFVEARIESPGRAFAVDDVYRMGWTDERARHASVLNRVYVAIASLRSSGLREHLVHDGRGYLLDPRRELVVDADHIPAHGPSA